MDQRVIRQCFTAVLQNPPASGEVIVASEFQCGQQALIRCSAAPLLAGSLCRTGMRTDSRPLRADLGAAEGNAMVFATTWTAGGTTRGLVTATGAGDPAAVAAVGRVVRAWSATLKPRRVVLAGPRSFCAGVERAIEIVERALARWGAPVYVRKQIVHNRHVVADLQQRGAVFVEELDAVPNGATVVFSAHGVSPAVRSEAAARGLNVVDAACPLVTKVHQEARRFAARGDTVVLIGHAGHEETEGILGQAPHATVLVQDTTDVARLRIPDPRRVSYLTQTTLAVDETAQVITALRSRFPSLRGPRSDDICYASTNRQNAVQAVAAESDLVLVVGSANSSNSQRLVELARRHGTPAHLIDDATEIRPEWLIDVTTIGLTAGASAPRALLQSVVDALAGLGPLLMTERQVATETIRFSIPLAVRTHDQ